MTRLVLLSDNSYNLSLGSIRGLDLSSFGENDYISVTLPDFPDEVIPLSSYFEITSNPDVDFSIGPTDSVSFTNADEFEDGANMELRFPLPLFVNTDLSSVTGVRFRVLGTGDDYAFKVMSVRCISENWQYAPVDLETISESLVRPVSPDGNPAYTEGIVWPILWQPIKPKDLSVSAEILTGSIEGSNSLTLYFREAGVSRSIMTDYEGMSMQDMDGLHPELGDPDDETQFYLYSRINWSSVESSIEMGSVDEDMYEFDNFDLEADTRYLVTFTAQGKSIRVKVDRLDLGYQQVEIYDTGVVHDVRFQEGVGRFGWKAELEDGDASIGNIRHRSANFGSIITKEYLSSTPVVGSQLVEASTPPAELLTAIGSGPYGGIVTSQRDESFKIETQGMMKGASTNEFVITDWSNTTIRFDIKRPEGDVLAYLYGSSGNIIQVPIPEGIPGQWQKVKQRLTERSDQTGRYRLVILKVAAANSESWYLRNLSIQSRAVAWSARGKDDPWGMAGDQWIRFHDTTNASNGGVMLKEPGRGLQVQAELLASTGSIYEFRTLPKYAEPGRFVWDQSELDPPAHNIFIVTDINGLTVDFAADVDLDEDDERLPISYVWYFGSHGHAVGKNVRKVFPSAGVYTAVLRATYADGTVQTPSTWTQRLS